MTFAAITFDCALPRLSTISVDITIDGAAETLTFETAREILVRMAIHFTNPEEIEQLAADLVRTSLQYAAPQKPRRLEVVK